MWVHEQAGSLSHLLPARSPSAILWLTELAKFRWQSRNVMQGESLATSVTESLRVYYLLVDANRETRSLPNCRSLRESFGDLTFGLTWRST